MPHLQMPFILESQREFPATYFTSPSDRNAILTYYSPGYGILPLPVGIWANFCDWRELVLFPLLGEALLVHTALKLITKKITQLRW